MATNEDTITTANKATASYVASEIWNINQGFSVLYEMLHGLMSMDTIDAETLNRVLWTATHVKEELDEAEKHAEALDNVGRPPNPS